jgi:hypothetical protein
VEEETPQNLLTLLLQEAPEVVYTHVLSQLDPMDMTTKNDTMTQTRRRLCFYNDKTSISTFTASRNPWLRALSGGSDIFVGCTSPVSRPAS